MPDSHPHCRWLPIQIAALQTGNLQGQCAQKLGFGAVGTSIVAAGTPAGQPVACEDLANLTNFPVPNTKIISAILNTATATLPAHCQVDGVINARVGSDGCQYGDRFQLRLPMSTAWNGRFMFQGGGGTDGSVPAATGSAGTLSPTLTHGWAVGSQDGGHENTQLALCASMSPIQFYLDAQGVIDFAYQSIEVATLTDKYLIASYYGEGPNVSYWVGCSTGGREGMAMSQTFPQYYEVVPFHSGGKWQRTVGWWSYASNRRSSSRSWLCVGRVYPCGPSPSRSAEPYPT
jgi:feruloyl esterase